MFSKYILVGLANTLLTFVIIFILMHFGLSIYISNVLGYIVGIMLSYVLNSIFTFITLLIYYQEYLAQLVGMGFYTITGFIINKLWVMK